MGASVDFTDCVYPVVVGIHFQFSPVLLPVVTPLSARKNLTAALNARLLPAACTRFIIEHEPAFLAAPGSGSNHQAWPGGYCDHLDELFGIAAVLYRSLTALRPLPFTLADVLLTLFLHDVEKVFRRLPPGVLVSSRYQGLADDQRALQTAICEEYDLDLTPEQVNALMYTHGEGEDYRKDHRAAGPLAAFVHNCDYWSARGWPDQPRASGRLPDYITENH